MSSKNKKEISKKNKKKNDKVVIEWTNFISKCTLAIYIILIVLVFGVTIGSLIWNCKNDTSIYKALELHFFSKLVNIGSIGNLNAGLLDNLIYTDYLSNQFLVIYYIFSVSIFGMYLLTYLAIIWYSFIDLKEKVRKINIAIVSTVVLIILNIILVLLPSILTNTYYSCLPLILGFIGLTILINIKYILKHRNTIKK